LTSERERPEEFCKGEKKIAGTRGLKRSGGWERKDRPARALGQGRKVKRDIFRERAKKKRITRF
jgi:hypothetical protein